MALNRKVLQKKRAKKAEQRKAKTQSRGIGSVLGFSREWAAAARAPVADVLAPEGLFEMGIGSVWFSRRLPNGQYALSLFLVDSFCLGIKNALYTLVGPDEYAARLSNFQQSPDETFTREHPAYARKLVEGAAAYARDLGFDPHPDYAVAKLIFGDVDAAACPARLSFGKDGKPFYVSGPNETQPAAAYHENPGKTLRTRWRRFSHHGGSGGGS